jgi:hypothetical protein
MPLPPVEFRPNQVCSTAIEQLVLALSGPLALKCTQSPRCAVAVPLLATADRRLGACHFSPTAAMAASSVG